MKLRTSIASLAILIITMGHASAQQVSITKRIIKLPISKPDNPFGVKTVDVFDICFKGPSAALSDFKAVPTKPDSTVLINFESPCLRVPASSVQEPKDLISVISDISEIRAAVKLEALSVNLDAHLQASNARQDFIENELTAELQARMDRWPAELLADSEAYEAFKAQLLVDLDAILQ